MGNCMTKIRDSQTSQSSNKIQPIQITQYKSSSQHIDVQQLVNPLPTRRQINYWLRRIQKICGNNGNNKYITQSNLYTFFNYTQLSKITIHNIYQYMKNDKNYLNVQYFVQGLKKIVSANDLQLSAIIYQIYYSRSLNPQTQYTLFQQQFKNYIKQSLQQTNSYNLKSSKLSKQYSTIHITKIIQLKTILQQRKNSYDNQKTKIWLSKNINFHNFKLKLLEQSVIQDQIQAYKYFYVDFCYYSSKISQEINPINIKLEKSVCIINWRWCEKMIKYFQEKYETVGIPNKIKRKNTLQSQPILQLRKYKRASVDLLFSNIQQQQTKVLLNSKNNNFTITRSSINQSNNTNIKGTQSNLVSLGSNIVNNNNSVSNQISTVKVKERQPGSGYVFKNHPGEIDNYGLIGNFQWELKRNIRKYVDYITIKQETLEKLIAVFGGGPLFNRRIIQGYIQLRPYFLNIYKYVYDATTNTNKIINGKLIKLYPSEYICNISLKIPQNSICYHRNIGVDWQIFHISQLNKTQKIMDQFSQTSFLIYMQPNLQQNFKKLYLQSRNIPILGDMYQSQTYKITDSVQLRPISDQKINVCVIDNQQKGYITFVVLNWSYHIQRKILLKQFLMYFRQMKNSLGITTRDKKIRGGISNMGNTCYMNAALQALFSALKDEQLNSIKGELAVQLKQMANYITQKKKSIFPVDFKTIFDRRVEIFKGQDQHDAHQFFLYLFQQIQFDNKQIFKKLFQTQTKLTNLCKNCKKSQHTIQTSFVVELPLRDFSKKQVKIDYITQNKNIQTIVFEIQQESTIQDWRKNFQKASGAKQYYMCQVQNSIITRTFNKQDISLSELFRQLQLQNQFLITAYQTKLFQTKSKLNKKRPDYRTYRNQKGIIYIAKVDIIIQNKNQIYNQKKMQIRINKGNQLQQKIVKESQLLRFPDQYKARQIYVKIINRDDNYNQNIGRPFVFKILDTAPISAVRQALQNCIGIKGYILRISPLNQHSKCQICGLYNKKCQRCFIQKQNIVPLCWVNNILQFVVVWFDADQYFNTIKRTKFVSQIKQPKIEDYDNFQLSMKILTQKQTFTAACQLCKTSKVQIQRTLQIIKWPNILIIHLARLIRNFQICKNHTKWKLEHILYIGNAKYVLRAVLCHIGTSADYGHYVTVSNSVCYDDELVTEMQYDTIKPEDIYMLFYIKVQ